MPFQDISEIETGAAYCAGQRNLQCASTMVISSHGRTIRPGGTYQMTATATLNAGRVIIYMVPTRGRTSNGTSRNSDRINLTNYEGGIRLCKNTKTMIWKNC